MTDYSRLRERMVQRQIAGRGVRSEKVLDAMRKVPRERFLPNGQGVWAYDDAPLPIGDGQTISQPTIASVRNIQKETDNQQGKNHPEQRGVMITVHIGRKEPTRFWPG